MTNPHHYLTPSQRVPGYLPYPHPVGPGDIPVPNASSVDWPQSQFAPEFFPAGHASFQPYVYPDNADTVVLYGDAGDDAYTGPLGEMDRGMVLAAGVAIGVLIGHLLFSGKY